MTPGVLGHQSSHVQLPACQRPLGKKWVGLSQGTQQGGRQGVPLGPAERVRLLQSLVDMAPKYILEQFLQQELLINITEHEVSVWTPGERGWAPGPAHCQLRKMGVSEEPRLETHPPQSPSPVRGRQRCGVCGRTGLWGDSPELGVPGVCRGLC